MGNSYSLIQPVGVKPDWNFSDYWGAIKVRSSIGRNDYKVNPGLYKIGRPTAESEVFVSANYKYSFDVLRKNLLGLNAWILVLDTKGVNVWCAAGKGTFGTEELNRQIELTNLKSMVSHKRIIVPQLGAPGVSAHLVKEKTGFNVKFGPVRAKDIKDYLKRGYKKDDTMRLVNFGFLDRLTLVPVEIMNYLLKFILVTAAFLLFSGISKQGFSFELVKTNGAVAAFYLGLAFIAGTSLTPVLLPYLPFRSFSGKGLVAGSIAIGALLLAGITYGGWLSTIGLSLIGLAISSFLAMNFTGASTYTSLSGVKKEMKVFVPIQIALASIGLILIFLSKFI